MIVDFVSLCSGVEEPAFVALVTPLGLLNREDVNSASYHYIFKLVTFLIHGADVPRTYSQLCRCCVCVV